MRTITTHHVNKDDPETPILVSAVDVEGSHDVHEYMVSGFDVEHFGGITSNGHMINFQNGDPANGWNGLTMESLLAVCADRLESIQCGPWACVENEMALMNIHKAIIQLHNRYKRNMSEKIGSDPVALEEATQLTEAGGSFVERPTGPLTEGEKEEVERMKKRMVDNAVNTLLALSPDQVAALEAQDEQNILDNVESTMGVEVEQEPLPRLVPVITDESRHHFLTEEQAMPITFTMDDKGHTVKTGPLKTDMGHDLIALSYDRTLDDLGLISHTDTVGVEAGIEGFYIEFKHDGITEVLPFSTDLGEGIAKIEPFCGQTVTLAVSFEGVFTLTSHSLLAVADKDNVVNWDWSRITKELIADDIEVNFRVGLYGLMKMPYAAISVSPSHPSLHSITKVSEPGVEADVSEETKMKITHLLKTATVIGFDIVAYRQCLEPKGAST